VTIDLDAAVGVFAASRDGTVGLEEEFAVLDAQTLDMVPRFEELRDTAEGPLAESISGELISSEIEIRSGRGEDLVQITLTRLYVAWPRVRPQTRNAYVHRALVNAAIDGDWATARSLNRRYFPLITANFWESSPGPVKCVMAMMGRLKEAYRLPIVPVTPATRVRLKTVAEELGLLTH